MHPFPLASVFTGGMRRDVDRAELPGGSAWNLVDFIPDELQAATAGRGGWTYAGPALTAATSIKALGLYPDSGILVAIDQQPKAWNAISGAALTGTPTAPNAPLAYHRGRLIIPGGGAVTPTSYNGTTVATLTGAPSGQLVAAYKDH